MTIKQIEEAIGNDRRSPITLVLESGQQLELRPQAYGKTQNGQLLFIPLKGEHFALVETSSVKAILK